ncbi:MAG: response regulator [Hirschia sp.]|nr:response regulator [Hirschia sp.]MBF18516.1 response regulator [Hirschia sp.]|tara:strand:- start:1349 stop:2131 length:783 start_codon:yes stop_codon:yes gene_type:complete
MENTSQAGLLVLEDSVTQAKLISRLFEAEGFHVVVVSSARELTSSPKLFDMDITAALIDVHFGEVNGLKLIKPLAERWPGVVQIMMTANDTDDFRVLAEAREMGAHLMLRKPFGARHVQEISADIQAIENTGRRRRHVVVIDDSATTCKIAERVIKAYGFRVSTFQKGEDAIQQLSFDHVDAVLTDMNMPGMGGVELIRLVRDLWHDVGIVAMSADDGKRASSKARNEGADVFIPKPFGPEELMSALKMVTADDRIVYVE